MKERHFDIRRDYKAPSPGDRMRWGAGVLVLAVLCYLLSAVTGEAWGPLFSDLSLILAVVGLAAVALGLFRK